MNKKVKAFFIGVPLLAAVVGGILLLLTKPIFFLGALLILGVLYAGYYLGQWIIKENE